MKRSAIATALLSAMLIHTGLLLAQTTSNPSQPTPQQTGQRIGTIISSAIDTALPIFGKVMDLFRGGNKSASKDDVQKATDQAKKDVLAAIKLKVSPTASVAKELSVIQVFSTAAVNAGEPIANINHLLEAAQPDFDQISTEWTIAKNYMDDIVAARAEDIRSVSDPVIQVKLLDLQNSRRDLWVRIENNITRGKNHKSVVVADLRAQVAAFSGLLKGLNSLAAVEFANLKADVDDLVKWASASQGSSDHVSRPTASTQLLQIVDKAIKTSKVTIQSTSISSL